MLIGPAPGRPRPPFVRGRLDRSSGPGKASLAVFFHRPLCTDIRLSANLGNLCWRFSVSVKRAQGSQVWRAAGRRVWKLSHVAAWVGARPLAWVDGERVDVAFAWADEREVPTLLLRTAGAIPFTLAASTPG